MDWPLHVFHTLNGVKRSPLGRPPPTHTKTNESNDDCDEDDSSNDPSNKPYSKDFNTTARC